MTRSRGDSGAYTYVDPMAVVWRLPLNDLKTFEREPIVQSVELAVPRDQDFSVFG